MEEADAFLRSTRLFSLAESLGGVESSAEHPGKMIHGSIPSGKRAMLGIGNNLIMLSVGVEEEEDLVHDVWLTNPDFCRMLSERCRVRMIVGWRRGERRRCI